MTFDPKSDGLVLGVVGAGTMGKGIAQIGAQAGVRVLLFDAKPEAVEAARASIAKTLAGLVAKGRLTQEAVDKTLLKLEPATSLQDLAPCDVVVEAIIEDMDAKIGLFRALEAIVGPETVLATNTSSLSVTALAAACKKPDRVAGWHFFNPVPLMKLVEVIEGVATDPQVGDALVALGQRLGHTAVRAADSPGFLVNHAGRGLGPEGMRLVAEGVASFADIDRILRDAAGFRMGPFELMDLLGLDTAMLVMESLYEKHYHEQRFRVTPLLRQYAEGGLLGRKSGRGFYSYAEGAPVVPPEAPVPLVAPRSIWISSAEPELASALSAALAAEGAALESGAAPSAEAIIIVTPLGQDVSTAAVEQGLDPSRTVGVDGLFPLDKRRTLMASPATDAGVRDAAHAVLAAADVPVTVVRDSPGFVAQRVVAMVVGIGCDIAQQRIATPTDIDAAARLGLGYPAGPLDLGDRLGPARILRILDNLFAATHDPRYRASLWLRRRANLGLSLLTDD